MGSDEMAASPRNGYPSFHTSLLSNFGRRQSTHLEHLDEPAIPVAGQTPLQETSCALWRRLVFARENPVISSYLDIGSGTQEIEA